MFLIKIIIYFFTTAHRKISLQAQWNEGYSLSLLPVLQLARLVHSRWLAHLFGMGFHWHCDCSPGFTLMHSTLALKLLFLAVLESRALLSSNLEKALYKSMY